MGQMVIKPMTSPEVYLQTGNIKSYICIQTGNIDQMKGANLGEFEELVLLTIGVLGEEAYGISIRTYLKDKTGRNPSIGALHSALTRLESKGYLVSSMEGATDDRRGRRKRFYVLTTYATDVLKQIHSLRSEMIRMIPSVDLP